MTQRRSRPKHLRLAAGALLLVSLSLHCGQSADAQAETVSKAELQAQALRAARQAVNEHEEDAQAHLRLADVLRQSGRFREASKEYLAAAERQPELFVAYHYLSQICDDNQLLDEAAKRLSEQRDKAPKDLMLRVALSEVLEKRKKYHDAARTLIDLQYANGVPPKYTQRVEARIHFLLTKAKELQQKQDEQPVATDEELDVVPSPLPDSNLRKGLTASKIKDSKELKGMGHVPLLP